MTSGPGAKEQISQNFIIKKYFKLCNVLIYDITCTMH